MWAFREHDIGIILALFHSRGKVNYPALERRHQVYIKGRIGMLSVELGWRPMKVLGRGAII